MIDSNMTETAANRRQPASTATTTRKALGLACACLLFAVILTACVPSLYPLYTDDDLIFDPALVGQWLESEGGETWTFTRIGVKKRYRLVQVDEEGKKGEFIVHLLKVDDHLFLDLFPANEDESDDFEPFNASGFYTMHFAPVHTFMYVDQIEPKLRVTMLDFRWLEKLIKAQPDALRHETVEGSILITARAKELQAFLIAHLDTEGAFGDLSSMTRIEENLKKDDDRQDK